MAERHGRGGCPAAAGLMRWLVKQVLTIGIPLIIEHIRRRYKRAKAEQQARKEAAENAEDIEDSRRRGERDRGLNNERL